MRQPHMQTALVMLLPYNQPSSTPLHCSPFSPLTFQPPFVMQQPQHQPDLIALYHWLHRILKQHKLSTFTNVLLRDAVTVAMGVKPAALLDFHLPQPVLEQILQRCRATDAQLFAPLVLLTLATSSSCSSTADTAVFFLHRPSFLDKSRLHAASVQLVDVSPSLPSPQLLTNDTATVITDQLHSFTTLLSTTLEINTSASRLTLHSPPSVCLPTLCGHLLLYPLLYTFPSSTAADVPSTNCLSNRPLTLFTLSLHPTALLSRLSPSFASECGCVRLQSFSVPTELLSESSVVTAMQAWEKRVDEACSTETVRQWVHRLTVSTTAVRLPHVSL